MQPVANEDRRRDDQPGADTSSANGHSPEDPAVAEHGDDSGDVFPPVPTGDPSLQLSSLFPNLLERHLRLVARLRLPQGLERALGA